MTQQQTPAPRPQSAVARSGPREVSPLSPDKPVLIASRSVDGLPVERQEVERIEHVVRLPAAYQFQMGALKTRRSREGGNWHDLLDPATGQPILDDSRKVGITSDGYLFLNKTLGMDLVLPPTVIGRDGEEHKNPIHEDLYIAMRGGIIYRSDFGQLLWYEETIDVDFWQTYQDARLNQFSSAIVLDKGRPVLDDGGFPMIAMEPGDELKAARVLSALRASGLKRTTTTLFTRCLKVATGIKSLPIKEPAAIDIRLVTFRDLLSDEERLGRAMRASSAVYGGVGMRRPLEPDEVADLASPDEDATFLGSEETDRIDRSRSAAAKPVGQAPTVIPGEHIARAAGVDEPAPVDAAQDGSGIKTVWDASEIAAVERDVQAGAADAER